jgi:SAM-dependent methyltransferase
MPTLEARAVAALRRFNQRHPWSHNDHYHRWIVCRLPAGRRAALDVGCGQGTLVGVLRERFDRVDGLDADPGMAAVSAARFADDPRVRITHGPFEAAADVGPYDAVTMVAVLHHLELEPALAGARELLAPGGRLLVVGLARVGSPAEVALDVVSVLLNPIVGLVRHPRAARDEEDTRPVMPVRPAAETYAEVAATARRVLPGARFRRRLFFRYTLEWTRPD